MPIFLHGPESSSNYEAGQEIKRKLESDSRLSDKENEIHIIPSVRCYGQEAREIDLVLFGSLNNYFIETNCKFHSNEKPVNRKVKISNFFITIEVKKQTKDNIKIYGSECRVEVYYPSTRETKDVTEQCYKQFHSLRRMLEENGCSRPFIVDYIYFPNVLKADFELDDLSNNILFSDFSMNEFWIKFFKEAHPIQTSSSMDLDFGCISPRVSFKNEMGKYKKLFIQEIPRTKMDRTKIEAICKNIIDDQKYIDKLGKQLLIFRGSGGTGKTIYLMRLAHDLCSTKGCRVLILTYNNALVTNIQRLFAVMGISEGVEDEIHIKTIHSFFWRLFSYFRIADGREDWEEQGNELYGKYKGKLLSHLAQLSQKNVQWKDDWIKMYPGILSYDFVMIDESQDIPTDERDILCSIFGPNNLILADGKDQLIRQNVPCDWIQKSNNHQIVSLKRSLRQKPILSKFIRNINEKLEYNSWEVDDNDEMSGGKVIFFEGEYTKELHERLMKLNIDNKNNNIDMLFCVPSKDIYLKSNQNHIAESLQRWGYNVWDATNYTQRKEKKLKNVDEFRIVNYESCRGLEGWICVNFALDKFFEQKKQVDPIYYSDRKIIQSTERTQKDYAIRWLLIPMSRAVDTLVIQLCDPTSKLYDIFKELYENNKENYEWIE